MSTPAYHTRRGSVGSIDEGVAYEHILLDPICALGLASGRS
jgi:hypothetical protein